jgi:L-ribulose-5-phosphate 3-epimerase
VVDLTGTLAKPGIIGIMEGRLIPPEPGRFQAFPRQRWRDEFALAAAVPLDYIEWIYDIHGQDVNPLVKDPAGLRKVMEESGVGTHALCADCFMDWPFLRCTEAECTQREELLHRLLRDARGVGMTRLVLPFVDASRIESAEDEDTVVRVLNGALSVARECGVELHLETSLNPEDFARLLDRVPDAMIGVNYDSGNSCSLGYDAGDEFAAYGERIGSVHIKDRARGGGTVPLGTGAANFAQVFREMEKIGYRGDITLQAARGEPGDEVAWARKNRAFVAGYWPIE